MIQTPAGQNFDVRIKRTLDYFQPGYGVATMSAGSVGNGALELLGNEWQGLALDFLTNTSAWRVATGSEQLTGSGPYTVEVSIGMDFMQDNYTMVV